MFDRWCRNDHALDNRSNAIRFAERHVSRKRRQNSISSGKPILRFLKINNQNYRPIARVRHFFSVQLYTGKSMAFILFLKPQYWYVCNFEKKRVVMITSFDCFMGYSLWTVVIPLHIIYFTDWFFWSLSFRNYEKKTHEFTVKFDQNLRRKDRTEDNLTD